MRAVPTIMASMVAPTAAMSSAKASGRLPCIHRNVTSTLLVFCNMKMIRATVASAAAQIPIQVAPVRVRGIRLLRDGGCGSPGVEAAGVDGAGVEGAGVEGAGVAGAGVAGGSTAP